MVFTASENANTELERQWFEFDISVLSDQEMSNRISELNIMGFLGKGLCEPGWHKNTYNLAGHRGFVPCRRP